MSLPEQHRNLLFYTRTNEALVPYTPLTPEEFETLTQREDLKRMEPNLLDRLWLKPVQRMLQWKFGIDQRRYTTGTVPTLAELKEDFIVASAICVDKFSQNPEDVKGNVSVQGASSILDQEVPARASMLLERYKRPGGRISRC
jgi:hypothetical protein